MTDSDQTLAQPEANDEVLRVGITPEWISLDSISVPQENTCKLPPLPKLDVKDQETGREFLEAKKDVETVLALYDQNEQVDTQQMYDPSEKLELEEQSLEDLQAILDQEQGRGRPSKQRIAEVNAVKAEIAIRQNEAAYKKRELCRERKRLTQWRKAAKILVSSSYGDKLSMLQDIHEEIKPKHLALLKARRGMKFMDDQFLNDSIEFVHPAKTGRVRVLPVPQQTNEIFK